MSINRDQLDNTTRSILHNSRGIDLAERGWLDEAIREFKIAVNAAPDFAQGYDNLATAHADKGELFEALAAYAQALALDPENPIALHNLGCFLSNHGNKLATQCFKHAIKADPDLYEARYNLGLCFAAEDNHEKAIAQFEEALACNDHDQEARFQLALSFIALEKYAQAIKEILKLTKINPEHEQAWFFLATSYEAQGFLLEAVNAFAKAITLDKNHIEAHLGLASLLFRLERSKEAIGLIKRAMNLDPKLTEEFIANDELMCNDSRLSKLRKI